MDNLKTYRNRKVGAPVVVLGLAALALSRNLFKMYNLGSHPVLTESESSF